MSMCVRSLTPVWLELRTLIFLYADTLRRLSYRVIPFFVVHPSELYPILQRDRGDRRRG